MITAFKERAVEGLLPSSHAFDSATSIAAAPVTAVAATETIAERIARQDTERFAKL
eukprot:SAG22_NODE_18704_length_282_cov_1.409836_1_plen_55_part_10